MKEINEQSFQLIKQIANNISESKKLSKGIAVEDNLPHVIGVKLTNRCNLRCKHCYEWNEDGYHHNLIGDYQKADVDLDIVKKCIDGTEKTKAMFYLWGGEPLLYNDMDNLLDLLCEKKRYTVICTNATLLERFYDKLIAFEDRIELLLAIDGDSESHDKLRGQGNFDKIMSQIKPLIKMKQNGIFKGRIAVHTMVSNENVDRLYETVCYLDSIGVDNLLICLPWYISEETSKEMDGYFNSNFSQFELKFSQTPSWYAYKYKIEEKNYSTVQTVLEKIRNSKFNMNIKYQPDIQGDELITFLKGDSMDKCAGRECYTVFSRVDVLPDGSVTSCKHFQEFAYGDLNKNTLQELWNSSELKYIRDTISSKQMPVCSKCNNLYNHSYKKK